MHLRQMVTAFIFHDDCVLMMKRSSNRLFQFEFWSGIGGHMEPEEINRPQEACLREIREESGFEPHDIADFSLRYILLRLKEDEIRQQYVYFGRTSRKDYISSDEGELSWIKQEELLKLHLSTNNRLMLEDYLQNPGSTDVKVGTIAISAEGEPFIQWTLLKDPMIF